MFSDDGIGAGKSLNSAKINSSIVRAGVSRCGFKINRKVQLGGREKIFLDWL